MHYPNPLPVPEPLLAIEKWCRVSKMLMMLVMAFRVKTDVVSLALAKSTSVGLSWLSFHTSNDADAARLMRTLIVLEREHCPHNRCPS